MSDVVQIFEEALERAKAKRNVLNFESIKNVDPSALGVFVEAMNNLAATALACGDELLRRLRAAETAAPPGKQP